MKGKPSIGATGGQRFMVETRHAIYFAGEQMPAALATPWLVSFLEHAARDAVKPWLEPGESTVGTFVEIRHLAATPVGRTVTCLARVVQVDGRSISFQLEARDEHEVIGRGFHKRHVISVKRFTEKMREKAVEGNAGQPG